MVSFETTPSTFVFFLLNGRAEAHLDYPRVSISRPDIASASEFALRLVQKHRTFKLRHSESFLYVQKIIEILDRNPLTIENVFLRLYQHLSLTPRDLFYTFSSEFSLPIWSSAGRSYELLTRLRAIKDGLNSDAEKTILLALAPAYKRVSKNCDCFAESLLESGLVQVTRELLNIGDEITSNYMRFLYYESQERKEVDKILRALVRNGLLKCEWDHVIVALKDAALLYEDPEAAEYWRLHPLLPFALQELVDKESKTSFEKLKNAQCRQYQLISERWFTPEVEFMTFTLLSRSHYKCLQALRMIYSRKIW